MDTYNGPSTQQAQPATPEFKFKKGRTIMVVAVTVVISLVLFGIGYYFLVYQKDLSNTSDVDASVFVPEEDEIEYKNDKYGFKIVVKREWNVNEFGTKVEFKTLKNSQITFEAFNDTEFASITEINERFCDSFETGFREGITEPDIAERFNFELHEQNGLKGCEAEGEILGFKQKYNVYYNPYNSNVYTVFYTSSDPATEEELAEALSSFTLISK